MTRLPPAVIAILVGLTIALWIFTAPAGAEERILSFHSDIAVGTDGALTVTETIRVRAEGRKIRRGIYRDFPTRSLLPSGTWRYVGFDLLDVRRDGEPEPHHVEYLAYGERIYAGAADVFIRPGEHTYTIRYRTTRQLRYFEGYDELYWNVTGNFWDFPIDRASASVTLPAGTSILRHAAYTGAQGARGSAYAVTASSDSAITFETTRPLGIREGLTIAVAFPEDVVPEPGPLRRALWHLWDNLGLGILFVGTLCVATFFVTAWQRVGRDPPRGIVIPIFEPPRGFSPAAVSYLHYWGLKRGPSGTPLGFVAALMSLAVKKRIRIVEQEDEETIAVERIEGGNGLLSPGERAIETTLFSTRDRVVFEEDNASVITKAQSKFRSAILREYRDEFFRNNRALFFAGCALAAATIGGFLIAFRPIDSQVAVLVPTFVSALIGVWLLFFGLGWLLRWFPDGRPRWLGAFMVPLGAMVLLPALLLPLAAAGAIPALAVLSFASLPVMCVLFFHLLRAPTVAGRKVMDEIEGFRLYLTVAESGRLNLHDAPDMSSDLFERYLPYAIGLGVEKPWSNAFAAHLARVAPDDTGHTAYHPSWYRGASWDSGNIGRATSGIASAIGSGIASATPSSSGSGSGGGGSSGGGGGGGGGGGW